MPERGRTVARAITIGTMLGAATLLVPITRPRPLLVWNVTASAPVGLYAIDRAAPVETGDYVAVHLPEPAHSFAAKRHYLPAGLPLIKRVAADAGHSICARGMQLRIDGWPRAERHLVDGRGRRLPTWQGCQVVRRGQLFLLSTNPDSFDGRYFGLVSRLDVIGKARLLWPR